jgi:hypothetical protein
VEGVGISDHVWSIEEIAALISEPVAKKRGSYNKRKVCGGENEIDYQNCLSHHGIHRVEVSERQIAHSAPAQIIHISNLDTIDGWTILK